MNPNTYIYALKDMLINFVRLFTCNHIILVSSISREDSKNS